MFNAREDILNLDVLLVRLPIRWDRRVKLAERTSRELMHRHGLWPLAVLGWWKLCRGELVPIAGKNHHTDAHQAGIPHGLKDKLSLSEEPAPCIPGVDGPILGKWDR